MDLLYGALKENTNLDSRVALAILGIESRCGLKKEKKRSWLVIFCYYIGFGIIVVVQAREIIAKNVTDTKIAILKQDPGLHPEQSPEMYDGKLVRVTGWLEEDTSFYWVEITSAFRVETYGFPPFVDPQVMELAPADIQKGARFTLYDAAPEAAEPKQFAVVDARVRESVIGLQYMPFVLASTTQPLPRTLEAPKAFWGPNQLLNEHNLCVLVGPYPETFHGYMGKVTLVGRWKWSKQSGHGIIVVDTREHPFPSG